MAGNTTPLGTLLGAGSAEADTGMLRQAFVETADYQALRHTTDFSYVVGRRGTGKSAIFQRLRNDFSKDDSVILLSEQPQDYEMLEFQELLHAVSLDYRALRPITRVLWTAHFLWEATKAVTTHYRFGKSKHAETLTGYIANSGLGKQKSGVAFSIAALREVMKRQLPASELPRAVVETYRIGELTNALRETLEHTGSRVVAIYDRLDEAWTPAVWPIAILGGLARTAAEYREKQFPIYQIVFIRDNMFRALAQFDDDFTRHVEAHTLRLQWDEDSLFHLVAARLRIALRLEEMENDAKVWNRFAQRELQGQAGFKKCLRYTLYRPRDILILLNEAYLNARRDNRDSLVESDVERSALRISQVRLEDLCKEYDQVLPGVRLFVSSFTGQPAQRPVEQVVHQLDAIAGTSDYSDIQSRDLVLFESGGEMLSALYSVGFIGVHDEAAGAYIFCHDGARIALISIPGNRPTLVHPCYWKALDVSITDAATGAVVQVNDDYDVPPLDAPLELRLQRLGKRLEELSGIPEGPTAARAFELWVLRAVRLLFSGSLQNIDLKPNPGDSLNQRDIAATNNGGTPFWKRILEDYHARQVLIECKNYSELHPADFRQVNDYLSAEYGNFAIVVRRGSNESMTVSEQERVKAMFFEHQKLIFVVPASILVLCVRKLRAPKRYDYAEFTFSKHMDHIVRSVLSMKHVPRFRRNKPKSSAQKGRRPRG